MNLGELFDPDIQFANDAIDVIPPTRQYRYVIWTGEVDQKPCHVEMKCIPFETFHKQISRRSSLPPIQGNWDKMNVWIKNIWEALYNPVTLYRFHERRIGIVHGHHRLRLMHAMGVNHIWYYDLSLRVGRRKFPRRINRLMRSNDRRPRVGTVSGVCESCKRKTKWKRVTFNRISDVRMYCKKCGEETLYPYPGVL